MGHRRGSNSKGRNFDQKIIDKIWDKGVKIHSKNPNLLTIRSRCQRVVQTIYAISNPFRLRKIKKREILILDEKN